MADALTLGEGARQNAKRLWKLADAQAWTDEQKRCFVLTGYPTAEAQQAAEAEYQRQGEAAARRERARDLRALAERRFFQQAREAGRELVRIEGQLTWTPLRTCSPRRAATTSRRRPQSRRVARTSGSRGDPPHQSDDDDPVDRRRAIGRDVGMPHISEPLAELLAYLSRRLA